MISAAREKSTACTQAVALWTTRWPFHRQYFTTSRGFVRKLSDQVLDIALMGLALLTETCAACCLNALVDNRTIDNALELSKAGGCRAQTSELILPIVDCAFSSITEGDTTAVRLFFLLRSVTNASNISLLIVSMSMQDYKVVGHAITGAAAVATLVQISDLRVTCLTHHFVVAIGYPYQSMEMR